MSLHWQPVGPEPASTYWTRRAAVALVALLVLYGVVSLLTGDDGSETLGQGGATPTSSAEPLPSESAAATPSASPGAAATPSAEAAPCADTDIAVTAATERDSYPTGAEPTLVLTVLNTSDRACRRDLGPGAAELLVTSGSDRIWSSDDCSPGGAPGSAVLDPGKSDVTRLTWAGTRSRPGCEGPKSPIEPGTYVVSARIGDLRVEGSAFSVAG